MHIIRCVYIFRTSNWFQEISYEHLYFKTLLLELKIVLNIKTKAGPQAEDLLSFVTIFHEDLCSCSLWQDSLSTLTTKMTLKGTSAAALWTLKAAKRLKKAPRKTLPH